MTVNSYYDSYPPLPEFKHGAAIDKVERRKYANMEVDWSMSLNSPSI